MVTTMFNEHIIIGHLGRDPKITEKVTFFSVATTVNRKVDGQWEQYTQWHDVSAFGYAADAAAKLVKGDLVFVKGPHETRKYKDKSGDEKTAHGIRAEIIKVLSAKAAKQAADETTVDDYSTDQNGDPF